MKKTAILTAVAIIMASCGGGNEFATVGKPIDLKKFTLEAPKAAGADSPISQLTQQVRSVTQRMTMTQGRGNDCPVDYFWNKKDGKKGCAIDEKVAVPAVFDNVWVFDCAHSLFLVEKNNKIGLVEAFKQGYIARCEYVSIDADFNRRLLYLKKADEDYETYSLDTGKKWEGTENWPPKKFPADIKFQDLTGFPHWKIESITCERTGGMSSLGRRLTDSGFKFTVKGTGLQNWNWNPAIGWTFHSYYIYLEKEDGQLDRVHLATYPNIRAGQPVEFSFNMSDNGALKDVKSVSFVIHTERNRVR